MLLTHILEIQDSSPFLAIRSRYQIFSNQPYTWLYKGRIIPLTAQVTMIVHIMEYNCGFRMRNIGAGSKTRLTNHNQSRTVMPLFGEVEIILKCYVMHSSGGVYQNKIHEMRNLCKTFISNVGSCLSNLKGQRLRLVGEIKYSRNKNNI